MYYKNESTFPITSCVNIEGCTDLVLQNASKILGILLLFKQVRLNRILCKSGNQDLNVCCVFTCEQDKKRCLKMLYFSALFTLPVALLLLVGGIYSVFTAKIWIALFEIVLAFFPICDLISLIHMRKWKVEETKSE